MEAAAILLVEHGASITTPNKNGVAPIGEARGKLRTALNGMITKTGCDVWRECASNNSRSLYINQSINQSSTEAQQRFEKASAGNEQPNQNFAVIINGKIRVYASRYVCLSVSLSLSLSWLGGIGLLTNASVIEFGWLAGGMYLDSKATACSRSILETLAPSMRYARVSSRSLAHHSPN
jgi:hypothetical protein